MDSFIAAYSDANSGSGNTVEFFQIPSSSFQIGRSTINICDVPQSNSYLILCSQANISGDILVPSTEVTSSSPWGLSLPCIFLTVNQSLVFYFPFGISYGSQTWMRVNGSTNKLEIGGNVNGTFSMCGIGLAFH